MIVCRSQFFTCSSPYADRCSKPLPWDPLSSPQKHDWYGMSPRYCRMQRASHNQTRLRCIVCFGMAALIGWSNSTPNLPTNIVPTNIARVKLSGKSPMGLGIPPLRIKIMLESNHLESTMLVGRVGVLLLLLPLCVCCVVVVVVFC